MPSSSSLCHRHARVSALANVPPGCSFVAGASSLRSDDALAAAAALEVHQDRQ
jgi:hypothetical protein